MTIQQHASFDSSAAELNATSKLVKAWESKNAKNAAKAGGISMMALSLAACGGSSTTTTTATDTTTTTDTTTVVVTPTGDAMTLTSGTDTVTASSGSLNGSAASVRFKDGSNETVSATNSTMQTTDNLIDGDTTDSDVLNVTISGAMNAITATNIETVNVTTAVGSSQAAVFTNFSGLKDVNVSGAHDLTVDDAGSANVNFSAYTQDVTINNDSLGGTADVQNITVSGGTWGSTDATQTNITLTADGTTGVLETLNITSAGSAANVFGLVAGSGATLKTVAVSGAADANVRVAYGDVGGKTIDASAATGTVTLTIDVHGQGTSASTDARDFTGVDLVLRDSTVGTDDTDIRNMAEGQKITLANDFVGGTIAAYGATYSAMNDAMTLVMDNATADGDIDVSGTLDIQNIETLNLESSGDAADADTSAVNSIAQLTGDFTTITITGDTSLDLDLGIDAVQTATSATTARTVAVDASAMTGIAYVELEDGYSAANTKVSYTVTGTGNKDTLDFANAAGTTITAGGGNDVITGSNSGNDTIDAGAGNDVINVNGGTDTLTGGAGADEYDVASSVSAAGSAAVLTVDMAEGNGSSFTFAASDVLTVTIDGTQYSSTYGTSLDATINTFVSAHGSAIEAAHNLTLAAGDTGSSTTTFTLTGTTTAVSIPTTSATVLDDSASPSASIDMTTSSVAAVSGVTTTITDFTVSGSDKDVIDYNIALYGQSGAATVVYEAIEAATAIGSTTTILELTKTTTDGSAAGLVSALGSSATNSTIDSGDKILIANYTSGGDAQIWLFTDASGADVAASELDLLITLENVTADSLTTDNFLA